MKHLSKLSAMLCFATASLCSSCSLGPKSSGSEVQHTIGETSSNLVKAPSCTQKEETLLADELAYVKKLAKYIIDSNPATFRGNLKFETFCFAIARSNSANARCMPDGTIEVTTGLLQLMKNDAQVAAVLSHELAHYTMNHFARKNTESRVKLEQEADEVGNEFYTRAHFDQQNFKKMFEQLRAADGQSSCSATSSPTAQVSSDAFHPSECARIEDIGNENDLHKNVYEKLKADQQFIDKSNDLQNVQKKYANAQTLNLGLSSAANGSDQQK